MPDQSLKLPSITIGPPPPLDVFVGVDVGPEGVFVRVGVLVGSKVFVGVFVGPEGVLVRVGVLVGPVGVFVRVLVEVAVAAGVPAASTIYAGGCGTLKSGAPS